MDSLEYWFHKVGQARENLVQGDHVTAGVILGEIWMEMVIERQKEIENEPLKVKTQAGEV